MGGVADAFAAAANRVESMRREGAERRELRGKRAMEAKSTARESFSSQGPKMDKYAGHVAELVRRQRQAGGWSTTSVVDKDNQHYNFGPEVDEADRDDWASHGAAAPSAVVGPASAASPDDAGAALDDSVEGAPVPKARPGSHPARPAAGDDDDDDFSSRSWLS